LKIVLLHLLFFLHLAASAAGIDLFVRGLRPGKAVFGTVNLEVEVLSDAAVATVEIWLDGELVEHREEGPYTFALDVGQENHPRSFEIVARDIQGEEARRLITTPALAVDLELDLNLQQLYVTVSRSGKRVSDLEAKDFTLFDEAVAQKVVTFERGDVPLTAVLLLDTSYSMRGSPLAASLEGAQTFVAEMRQLDLAKVIAFSDRVLSATPFTGEPATVSQAMQDLQAAGGSALNDHLYLALKRLQPKQGRKVIILLSDGVDVESVLTMRQVLATVRRSGALLYWIRPAESIGKQHRSAWRSLQEHDLERKLLADAIQTSGGRIFDIEEIEDAAQTFREILAELRGQYVFGYYPSQSRGDGSFRKIKVRTHAPGTKVRARAGYVDGF
jgi:Ca-activated chloride channel family protein